jgi:CRISPR-associated protein Cmr2
MAATPFLEMISRTKGEDHKEALLSKILDLFKESKWDIGERDGALVYESRLLEWVQAGTEQEKLRKVLSELLKEYAGNVRPGVYYALVLADGDYMGIVIDAQKDPEAHRELSKSLSEFAIEAPQIIEKHQGVPVYAGGDDILAYLPVHTALDCSANLAQKFKDKMKKYKALDNNQLEISPTLSTGVVIAHHLTPLSDVLELARHTEKKAKQVPGKNAIAITISKRSGVDRTIQGKWGELDIRLNLLIDLSRRDAISAGSAYELQELSRVLSQTDVPTEGIVAEALRIIRRKRESGGELPVSKQVQDAFQKWLEEDSIELDMLALEMIVAQIFANAYDMAGIPKE